MRLAMSAWVRNRAGGQQLGAHGADHELDGGLGGWGDRYLATGDSVMKASARSVTMSISVGWPSCRISQGVNDAASYRRAAWTSSLLAL